MKSSLHEKTFNHIFAPPIAALILCTFMTPLFVSCTKKEEQFSPSGAVSAALSINAITDTYASEFLQKRPSSTLGVFGSSFLSHALTSSLTSAVTGVFAASTMQDPGDSDSESALLISLRSRIDLDIIDYLNRSIDREAAFREYVHMFTAELSLAESNLSLMESNAKYLRRERSARRKVLTRAKSELKKAKRDENIVVISQKEKEVAAHEMSLQTVERERDTVQRMQGVLKDLISDGKDKLEKLTLNAEILQSGTDTEKIEALSALLQESKN